MALKISERLARSHPLIVAAVVGLRWLGRTAPGTRLGSAWYRRSARRVAGELGEVRGVVSVYVMGSTAQGNPLPGYSDIDLMLTADLPTAESELGFRRDVERIVRKHNRPLERFRHVDYVEARDLELITQLGDAFAIDANRRWKLLAGREASLAALAGSVRHRELASAARCMRVWVKQSSILVAARARLDTLERTRRGQRLLQVLVATWRGIEAGTAPDLPALLEEVRPHAPGEALLALCRDPARVTAKRAPLSPRHFVAAGLEAFDAHMGRLSRDFRGRWPMSVPRHAIDRGDPERIGSAAIRCGFACAELAACSSRSDDHLALVTTVSGSSAVHAVQNFESLLGGLDLLPASTFSRIRYPVLLTPAIRAAAALIEPFPAVGARLAAGAIWTRGANLGPPAAPSALDLDILTTISLVKMFWRPRGRALRFTKTRHDGLARMRAEIMETLPELVALREGHAVDYGRHVTEDLALDERALLERLRASLDTLRPELLAKLDARRRSPALPPGDSPVR